MSTFAEWTHGGRRTPVTLATGETFSIWSRSDPANDSSAPHATLLHGFPTHSYDWRKVVEGLSGQVRTLSFDFLGFGASDKPMDRPYSLMEQADLTEALWTERGIPRTLLVAHDYGVSVAEELLARRAEGRLSVELTGVVFLNGGIWPDLHRALPAQKLLLDPEQGPKLVAVVNEEMFLRSLGITFSPTRLPTPEEAHEVWLGVALGNGHRLGHKLIHYVSDRKQHEARWVRALESTDLERSFVWGALDPVSGGHVMERIQERFPHDRKLPLDDVGHWPAIEAPEAVVRTICDAAGVRYIRIR